MKRVNLWHRIRSISSACLILMLIRIELTEGSISTRSFSLRDIVRGLSRTSFDPLYMMLRYRQCDRPGDVHTVPRPLVCCAARQPGVCGGEIGVTANRWHILTCDEKFSSVSAAVSDDLTAARYGLSTFDCPNASVHCPRLIQRRHRPSRRRRRPLL